MWGGGAAAARETGAAMRVLVTADLHYENERSRVPVRVLAQDIVGRKADALVLAGDTFALDFGLLDECLALFSGFTGEDWHK